MMSSNYADDTQVYVSFSIPNEENREIAFAKIKIRGNTSMDARPLNIGGARIGHCDLEQNHKTSFIPRNTWSFNNWTITN